MTLRLLLTTLCLTFSCGRQKELKSTESSKRIESLRLNSAIIQEKNPLLPLLEPGLWQKLIETEKKINASNKNQAKLQEKFLFLAKTMSEKHPLIQDAHSLTLGGITLIKKNNSIEIPAEVIYPNHEKTDNLLEVLLCTPAGRNHETLFQSHVRPLHLEILLHYAGFSKEKNRSVFKVEILTPAKTIPLGELITDTNGKKITQPTFIFSGSPYQNGRYAPDQTGDLITFWLPHESVLSSSDDAIASGQTQLLANKHQDLPDSSKIILILTPVKPYILIREIN